MNTIEKSVNDNRIYKWFELKNKLKVIIIKDNNNTNCGALLNVHVGGIHDTLPGTAHFLEHLLFMGSKKYPDVTNFFDNISKTGGFANAMTSDTDTTYYFSCDSSKFLDILDMFADFFVEPLLRKDQIDKEINAVASESKKNLLSDTWISIEMIKKCIFDDYPINHYTCGTKKLLDVENNYILIKEFFDKYYSANIMNLILYINDKFTDDKIIDFLDNTFGMIKNNNVIINNTYGNIIKPNQCIKYLQIKNINKLIIVTELPVKHTNLLDNPMVILEWILVNRTKNSLYDILNKKKYIINIIFDTLFNYDDYNIIIIEFELTEIGYKNYDEIIQIYFQYINSIKKTQVTHLEKIYKDILKINKNNYEYPNNKDIIDTMTHINTILHNKVSPDNLLNYLVKYESFDKLYILFNHLLDNIKLYNSSIVIGSDKIEIPNYIVDDIYNIKYSISRLEPIKINKNIYDIIDTNKFINTGFQIIKNDDSKFPEKIKDKKYNLFYNFNSSFNVPDVNIYILIETNKILSSPKSYLEFILFLELLVEDNTNIINSIKIAGNSINFNIEHNCLYIYISGNNKNISDIVNTFINIINKYKNGKNNKNNKKFDLICEITEKLFKNFKNTPVINKIKQLINKEILKKLENNVKTFFYKNKLNLNNKNIINLNKKTSIPEAIEIVKNSSYYLGIDSFLSIVATSCLTNNKIQIKTKNKNIKKNKESKKNKNI